MKARRYESWGVHLGWALPIMGDVLVITAKGAIFSTYSHIDVRHLLETGEYRNYGATL
jgi:hypothetical protein